MIFAIDNGHGKSTPGKQSTDGRLKEWQWTREIAYRVQVELTRRGKTAILVTPEDNDTPLYKRVSRINAICNEYGKENVCVVSIHVNADGYGTKWTKAQGWSVFCSATKSGGVSKGSALLADCLCAEAEKLKRKVRRQHSWLSYWVQSLAICRDTKCPAVLTENYFMTNLDDLNFIMSRKGMDSVVDLHVKGLLEYEKRQGNG